MYASCCQYHRGDIEPGWLHRSLGKAKELRKVVMCQDESIKMCLSYQPPVWQNTDMAKLRQATVILASNSALKEVFNSIGIQIKGKQTAG